MNRIEIGVVFSRDGVDYRRHSRHIVLQELGQRAVTRKPILQVICIELGIFRRGPSKSAAIECCWRRETHGGKMAVHVAYRRLGGRCCGGRHRTVPLALGMRAVDLLDLGLDVEVGDSLEDIAKAVEFVDAVRHVAEGLQRCDEVGQETEVCVGSGGIRDDVAECHREWSERCVE
jgi:hypothetical protein